PRAEAAIGHSADWARAAAQFIETEADDALAMLQGLDPATLRWQGWLALPTALRDCVLRCWLRALALPGPSHLHVAGLERQLGGSGDGAICVAWAGCELRRYRDLLYAMAPLAAFDPRWESAWDGTPLALPGGGLLRLESGNGAQMTAPLKNFV